MILIGITGSIGCGKSVLAGNLRKLGYTVYNPDVWVRYLYKNDDFLKVIKESFPETFDEKGIFNKRKLRQIVFDDSKKLKKLENIIHPLLKKKIKDIVRRQYRRQEFVFLDIALLFEMNLDKICDIVVVTDVNYEIQKERVMKRDHISEEDFIKIVKKQIPQKEKIEMADFVINTAKNENVNLAEMIDFMGSILK